MREREGHIERKVNYTPHGTKQKRGRLSKEQHPVQYDENQNQEYI